MAFRFDVLPAAGHVPTRLRAQSNRCAAPGAACSAPGGLSDNGHCRQTFRPRRRYLAGPGGATSFGHRLFAVQKGGAATIQGVLFLQFLCVIFSCSIRHSTRFLRKHMSETITVLMAAMMALLLGAEPSVAQLCCQFGGGCTQTTREDCINRHGAPELGTCIVAPGSSRCSSAPPPPPPPSYCCQLPGGCTDTVSSEFCSLVGGVSSLGTCRPVAIDRGPRGYCTR
jgi:hypothetical protein